MNPYWCTIVILVNLHLARGCNSTQLRLVKTSPKEVFVSEGASYTLYCEYNVKVNECSWLRNGSSVKIRDRYAYVIGNGTNTNICTFTVEKAEKSLDNAHWQCAACASSDYSGVDSDKINVTVFSKLEIRWNGTKMTKLYGPWNPDSSLLDHFRCVFERNPNIRYPRPYWKVNGITYNGDWDGMELRWDGRELWWDGMKLIQCIAISPNTSEMYSVSDPLTISKHTDRKLNVSVNGHLQSEKVTLKMNEVKELKCDSDGEPQPTYRWQYKNNDSAEWILSDEGDVSRQRTIVPKRVGIYRCVAFDLLDVTNVTSNIFVTVETDPTNPRTDKDNEVFTFRAFFVVIAVTIVTVVVVTCWFFTVRIILQSIAARRHSTDNDLDRDPVGESGEVEDEEYLNAFQGTPIPRPPTIPLPPLPPRSTSLLMLSVGGGGATSVHSLASPRLKRLPPKPPTGYGSSYNTLATSNSSSATARSLTFQKAPQPLPRQTLNAHSTEPRRKQEQRDGYVLPDRPDLWPSNSNKRVCSERNNVVGTDDSVYSTIVSFDNSKLTSPAFI